MDEQIEKLMAGVFIEASQPGYVRKKYFAGVRREKDESIEISPEQVVECARILRVQNPLNDDVEEQLPLGFVWYKLHGDIDNNALQEPDKTPEDRYLPFLRSASHPDAKPMAWLVKGNKENESKELQSDSLVFGVDVSDIKKLELRDGDFVVVEQSVDGLIVRTLRIVCCVDDVAELYRVPRSENAIPLKMSEQKTGAFKILSLIDYHLNGPSATALLLAQKLK